MSFLLSVAPYLAFFIVVRVASVEAGLWTAFAVSLSGTGALLLLGRGVKLLQGGTLGLFAALAVFTAVTHWAWNVSSIRLAMNSGLTAIVLASLAVGRPFTMEYARRRVPPAFWDSPLFLSVNQHITWVWAATFALMAAIAAGDLLLKGLPAWVDGVVSLTVFAVAVRFTIWYPGWARRRAGDPWRPVVPLPGSGIF